MKKRNKYCKEKKGRSGTNRIILTWSNVNKVFKEQYVIYIVLRTHVVWIKAVTIRMILTGRLFRLTTIQGQSK